jgi:hypothetical protein
LAQILVSLRRILRSRQVSQNLVEFGLSAAAVAFVGLVGFSALAHAQAMYWGGPAVQTLDEPTPPVGTFMHPTRVLPADFTCDKASVLYGDTVHCDVSVTDVSQAPTVPSPPGGQVVVMMDSGSVSTTCNLSPVSSVVSHCQVSWAATTSADAGLRTAKPTFLPTDNVHLAAGAPLPSLQIRVYVPDVVISTSAGCSVPWTSASGPTWNVEIGHPVLCTASVTDDITHQNLAGVLLKWTSSPVLGNPLFTCFTNFSFATLNACQPPAQTYLCTTDSSGMCKIIFRDYPAIESDTRNVPNNNIKLKASAPIFATPPIGINSSTAQVKIVQPQSDHGTGFSVDCQNLTPNVTFSRTSWQVPQRDVNRTVTSLGTIHVHAGAAPTANGSVTCTVVVYDPSASASFDVTPPACTNSGPTPPGDPSALCNPDEEDSYPPFGDAGLVDSGGHTWPCASGLQISGHPVNMPALFTGEPEYASACQIIISATDLQGAVGTSFNLWAYYNGENVAFIKQHGAATSPQWVTVSFEP